MLVKCKNCLPEEGIEVPDFTHSEKSAIAKLKLQSPIHAVKYLTAHFKLSHLEAKFIVIHINRIYGKCNRCAFDVLDAENISCPICGALNLNWNPE